MQSRNVIIGIVVVVLVILGLWYWTSTPGQQGTGGTMGTTTNETAATTTGSTTGTTGSTTGAPAKGTTLKSLASQTSNFTCTLTGVSSSGQATGTIYGAGGKVRVDFSIPSNNGAVTSHVIRSNGYSYSWVDGQTTGTKAAITSSSAITAPASGGNISVDSATASECHPWVPDTKQFTPPAGISFVAH